MIRKYLVAFHVEDHLDPDRLAQEKYPHRVNPSPE
jgi:hypothetical protein